MPPQVKTSFIPKKPIVAQTAVPARTRGAGGSLVFLVSLILFLLSVLGAGGAFAYSEYMKQSIASASQSLDRVRAAFEPATIQELIRLEDRLTLSGQILDAHVAPSGLFTLIASTTLQSVSYNKFDYLQDPDGSATIALEGQTGAFSDIALQSDALGRERSLKNTIFSNFTVGQTGRVGFSVHADIDPNFILYRTLVSGTGL